MDRELLPNKNVVESSKLDTRSILFLKTFLPDNLVDCRQLQEGGTLPNIDGYLDILCPDGRAREKITVQVKHLTYPEKNGNVFYDIPQSMYAYAERHKGELVLFIACDDVHRKFYWRNIDIVAIEEFRNKFAHVPSKSRYYFKDTEKCGEDNIAATIEYWRKLYKQKMVSIKDDRDLAKRFVSQQKMYFNAVSSELHGINNSHIVRPQVNQILQWINDDSVRSQKNICLLVGDAGVGKSALLKDLISIPHGDGIEYLCIKADSIDDNGNPITLEKMRDALAYYSVETERVILIVDQIDALSQSLANDRKHLDMVLAVLKSLEDWPNVSAVVSCRKYDLEYDPELNRLKDKSILIEIGELTDEEVSAALNNIENGLDKKVDRVTAKLLRNVQMLDSFSILFKRNKLKINFNSQTDLYDALWDTVICSSVFSQNDIEMRESLMFKIAETIRKAGTLNPQFSPIASQKRAYEYLASNGLIRREGCAVSFFHQSFYEYTLARHYSETGNLFVTDIKKEIQGLELRSTVKAVLDFKRGHDIVKFVYEARSILEDTDIRLHLKLLTLSVLAFVDEPSRAEKTLIDDMCRKDERMLGYFLRGVSSRNWFPTIRKIVNGKMPILKRCDNLFIPIISCLSCYAFNYSEEVYGMINNIQDHESRLFAVTYVLRAHNDYNKSCVLRAFAEIKQQNAFFVVNLIQDAISSNCKFALEETEKLILDYLLSAKSYNKHDAYGIVEELCPKLCVEYSKEMLGILHRSICKTVRETAYQGSCYGLTMTYVFNGIIVEDYVRKILKMYENLLTRYSPDKAVGRSLILELLSLRNTTTLSIAFTAMAVAPGLYDGQIRSLLIDNSTIEECLDGDIEFYFLKMLRAWYDTLDENDAEWYQGLILSYKSMHDLTYFPERKCSQFLCPYLWLGKWKLICNTLRENSLIPEMKKCSQELMRRFGKKFIVEQPDHTPVAFCYSKVVDDGTYAKWPIRSWLNSFLKLDEDKLWKEARHISLSEHADSFKKCVSTNPDKFYDFIFDISARTDIQDIYKVAGLEGLLAGGVSPYSIWQLTKQYVVTEEFAQKDSYSFSQIVEYYIKEDNEYIEEIMKLCEILAISPLPENSSVHEKQEGNDMRTRANDVLTRAINSYQGRAAKILVHICAIPSRRPAVYDFFKSNNSLLHECVKTIPLFYLNVKDYYDEELYLPMLQALLSDMGSVVLYIQASAIQWCFYHRNDVVANYIDRIERDPSSHEILAQIYFYGIKGTTNPDQCERRLERVLSLNNEEVVAKIVEIAMKSYNIVEYRDVCIKYLERYASDNREKVERAYSLYCNSLPVEAFGWYCRIVKICGEKEHMVLYNQIKYVKKCISTYPILCYRFLQSQQSENMLSFDNEVAKVLFEIYRKLSYDEDTDAMNELLDIFDEYFYRDNRVMKYAASLLS